MSDRWVIWTYALLPGWENGGGANTRDVAREIRQDLIDEGYPPEFVSIRRESRGAPVRRPPHDVVAGVRAQMEATDADR